MKNKIFKHSLLNYSALFISCIFISLTLLSSQAFAAKKDDWSNSVVQKALLSGLRWCYSSGAINFDAGKISQFNNFNQLITGGNRQDYVALPSGLTSINRDSVDCKSLFKGSGSFKGVFELAGKPEYKGNIEGLTQKITFLEGMGYSRSNEEASKKCVYYIYAERDGGGRKRTTRQVCFKGGALTLESVSDDDYPPYFYLGSGIDDNVSSGRDLTIDYQGTTKYVSYTDSEGWDTFVGKLNKIMSTHFNYIGNLWFQGDDGSGQNDYGDAEFEMDLSGSGETADKPIKFLSQYQNYYSLSFSDKERLSYYIDTIKNVFYKGASTSKYLKCDISDPTLYGSYLMINVNIETMHKNSSCGIDTSVTSDTKRVYGFVWNRGKPYFDASGATKLTLSEVVAEINRLANILTEEEISSLASSIDGNSDGEVEQTCMNSGGAGSLGWIVCSLLDWMGDATEGLYNNIVKPALTVNASFFEDSATREAWEKFRDIANILFIVMVLFVVFSQLTGVGIDNYGIKKILPKLIVVAILINLSFLICVICVDLSNILGNGFQAFLDGLGTSADTVTISVSGGPSGADSGSVNIAMDAGIISVGVIAAAISVYAIYSNPAILLTLLIGAIGVMIAVLFVFILLAGRKAAIVLLAVLSPVAFILYLLPNTKKIFDKWLKLWEAMLFLYPICGLLIGGGNFASKLMLNVGGGDGIATVLTALVIGIIPIFFIPTVLKGAFAAMGTMGNAISGFGNRMRGGATKGLRNSRAYKNAQERGQESGIRRKAGYDSKGNRKWGKEGPNWRQRLLRGGKRSIARNALAYQKLQSEKGALKATEGADFMLETETANEMKRIVSSGDINDINKLQTGLQGALLANDRAKIRAYSDALFSKKEEGNKSVKAAYNAAVGAGADPEAMRTWANNVMQNHAGLKKDHGSLFAAAQGIVGGGAAQSTGDYLSTADPATGLTGQAALAGKVSKTSIGSMDDASFEEIFGGYNSNSPVSIPTGADAQAIGETAYNAIRENPDMNSKRLGYLRQLVAASGYSPDTQTVQFGANSQEMNALNQTAANTERTANGVDAVNAQLQQMHQLSGAQLDAKMAQLDDQTIGEIASDPQLSNNDPIVQAAQREYTRRDRERGPQFNP